MGERRAKVKKCSANFGRLPLDFGDLGVESQKMRRSMLSWCVVSFAISSNYEQLLMNYAETERWCFITLI